MTEGKEKPWLKKEAEQGTSEQEEEREKGKKKKKNKTKNHFKHTKEQPRILTVI